MTQQRAKKLEGRPLTSEEEAEALRKQGTSSIDEIPADAEIIEGEGWDDLLAKVSERDAAIRHDHVR